MTSSCEQVILLVDEDDEPIGVCDKLAAHQSPGLRHRALSAFVFDSDGRLILQRRAETKYHFPRLWSNTCCTHPMPDEQVVAAGERRLFEELGIRCQLVEVGVFSYYAADPASDLVEHEVDHVLVGRSDSVPDPNPREVAEVTTIAVSELGAALAHDPSQYTPWLPEALRLIDRAGWPGLARPNPCSTQAGES